MAITESFIKLYKKALSDEFCDNVIKYFDWCLENNVVRNRPELGHLKKDESVNLDPVTPDEFVLNGPNHGWLLTEFNKNFWDVYYKDYQQTFSILANADSHTVYHYKIQKTDPGGGYHVWHCENIARPICHRLAVFTVYLNDVEEGGETEFLYYGLRISPKKGSLCIFPAAFSHTHRGNPPLSGSKYILTGWVELI